jgi:hypothetical protein
MRDPRLGDDIDDFCVRCKRIMNHAVVSVLNNVPAKVRCRTCHSDHDYRHEQPPPPKVDLRKQALFTEVLKKVSPADAAAVADTDPDIALDAPLEAGLEGPLEADDAIEADGIADVEMEALAAPEPPVEAPKPKAKAKAKAMRKK